jgi:uncharacterized protein YjbJ (UPF0337 family)
VQPWPDLWTTSRPYARQTQPARRGRDLREPRAAQRDYQAMVSSIEGNWKQLKGKVKEQWGKLTDDDLDRIAGKRDQLEGKIQERYGYGKDQVRKEIDDWYATQRW